MSQTTLSSFLKALYESNEKTQAKSAKGALRFFPFLPCDNNSAKGSFYRKEESSNQNVKDQEAESGISELSNRSSFSVVESEDYIECTIESLRRLLVMPYLQFLRLDGKHELKIFTPNKLPRKFRIFILNYDVLV